MILRHFLIGSRRSAIYVGSLTVADLGSSQYGTDLGNEPRPDSFFGRNIQETSSLASSWDFRLVLHPGSSDPGFDFFTSLKVEDGGGSVRLYLTSAADYFWDTFGGAFWTWGTGSSPAWGAGDIGEEKALSGIK